MKKLIELGLAEECPKCKGTLMVDRFDMITGQPIKQLCSECNQLGRRLTDAGLLFARLAWYSK